MLALGLISAALKGSSAVEPLTILCSIAVSTLTALRTSEVLLMSDLSLLVYSLRFSMNCSPPFKSAMIGDSSQSLTTSGVMRPKILNAISFCENVLTPSFSMPSAMILLPDIKPVPLVHPITAPQIVRNGDHDSEYHLLNNVSKPNFDSE
ncbi:hypothetical protein OGAPHI_003553 [Ogataea philodendri]|uniref:Uncharacterized protein n=1 Tax=Ogataea philodendri TaxID=1378263 RepID=A0A9P8P809_9ASCO|nr:uncharacterized protein OGAPHI_003553 [Ogataea philodendri]KAH3666374.1 hypothetical protein OGAPHI_003553 [Ogataea philodendri]